MARSSEPAILLDVWERFGQIDLTTLMGDGTFCPASDFKSAYCCQPEGA